MRKDILPDGVMFNAYPDSCGGTLTAIAALLQKKEFENVWSFFYILPSMFNSDLDRGFSIVDYGINEEIASFEALKKLQGMNIELKLDFVLNHLSVQSPQFRDLLQKGDESEYIDFFIDWDRFWEGQGEIGLNGHVVPDKKYLDILFMRKPELPILKVPFPDGTYRHYWNTFYQKVTVERNNVNYLGQMDLNANSDKVWTYYDETLGKLKEYGAKIVRLDAFAYLHKEVGETNFFNKPGTWEYLNRLRAMADKYDLILLPEIHAKYEEKIHEELSDQGFAFYDFFFPGLVINAIETGSNTHLVQWIQEIVDKKFMTVNMLGCHDGIPLLDMKGLLSDEGIDHLINIVIERGGRVKNLYGPDGKKISYYQVNATFFSALNANPKKLLLARAIQMFMPGVPQVWYLDLFGGLNDYQAADDGGHKEINRTNLTLENIESQLASPLVRDQLKLLRMRNAFPAFGFDAKLQIDASDETALRLEWSKDGSKASFCANLETLEYEIALE